MQVNWFTVLYKLEYLLSKKEEVVSPSLLERRFFIVNYKLNTDLKLLFICKVTG